MEVNTALKSLLWSFLVVALLAVGALMVIERADESRENLMVVGSVPAFQFIDETEQAFSQDNLKGKISIVDFIFTNCQGPCPVMAINMKELYDFYAESPEVQFVSISVDPARDTPEVLREYAARTGVTDERWTFLHGELPEVQRLLEQGFYLAADNLPMGHTTKFVLVDQLGQIRGYYDYNDRLALEVLKQNVQHLNEEHAG